MLKPGGRVYLDASASRDKYDKPNFIARYIFPADHAFLCLHDFLRAVAKSPLEVLTVDNDRHNYFLACRAWAENLDAARDEIIARWGETLYRRFPALSLGLGPGLSERRRGGLSGGTGTSAGGMICAALCATERNPRKTPAYASSCRSDRSVRVGFDRPAPPLWR